MSSTQQKVCPWFRKGKCFYGSSCKYHHEGTAPASQPFDEPPLNAPKGPADAPPPWRQSQMQDQPRGTSTNMPPPTLAAGVREQNQSDFYIRGAADTQGRKNENSESSELPLLAVDQQMPFTARFQPAPGSYAFQQHPFGVNQQDHFTFSRGYPPAPGTEAGQQYPFTAGYLPPPGAYVYQQRFAPYQQQLPSYNSVPNFQNNFAGSLIPANYHNEVSEQGGERSEVQIGAQQDQNVGIRSAPSSPARENLNTSSDIDASQSTGLTPDAMAPAPIDESVPVDLGPFKGIGPHPSFIQVAKPYYFEQEIQKSFESIGADEAKEATARLQGVQWIDSVRKAMQLPVKTFNVACCYYHKFRLVHAETEYMYIDAAAAALFSACKIEDTLKKSRDILCAAYNLKVSLSDQVSPDDTMFDESSKRLVGLERLMLESAGFDFRSRYPQEFLMKILKTSKYPKNTVGMTSYNMCVDIYRTYAPLKQTASTMAIACTELAVRLHEADMGPLENLLGDESTYAKKLGTDRAQVMETLLDLLDLYTHHRPSTTVGPEHPIDAFIQLRITLNKEATSANLPRYTEMVPLAAKKLPTNGVGTTNGRTATSSPTDSPTSNGASGSQAAKSTPAAVAASGTTTTTTNTPTTSSPAQAAPGATTLAPPPRARVGLAGRDGTVRFMLDAEREHNEKEVVESYIKEEWEEYEEVIERPARDSRAAAAAPAPAPPVGPAANVPTAPRGGRERDIARDRERDREREREMGRDRDRGREQDRHRRYRD